MYCTVQLDWRNSVCIFATCVIDGNLSFAISAEILAGFSAPAPVTDHAYYSNMIEDSAGPLKRMNE